MRSMAASDKLESNLLDRFFLWAMPEYGARRIAVRRQFAAAERLHSRFARIEAAENSVTRSDRWLVSRLSPDSQQEQDQQSTRDRSRDLYTNDATGGAVDDKVNHVIGTGHTPQARVKGVPNADAINVQIEDVYRDWSPMAGVSGTQSLWALSRVAARHNEFDGESFTVLSDWNVDEKPIPMAVQVIDPERVATPPDCYGDPQVRLGIRTDENGQVLGYYVQQSHPGDTRRQSLKFDFIPAARMIHVYEQWVAEQSRGLPWMTRAINRVKDAKDVDEAHIISAQVEACYAGFVKTKSTSGHMGAAGASSGTTRGGQRTEDIVPGTLRYLGDGEDVVFSSPVRPGNSFAPFMEWNYRRVAAAINWPYEMVVKNWSGISFAGGRIILSGARRSTEVGQKMMGEKWFDRVWRRMVEEAVIFGLVDVNPVDYMLNRRTYGEHIWIAPRWDYALNPGEEVAADVDEVANNLALVEDKLGKRGYDLEDFLARKEREHKLFAKHGLTPAVTQNQVIAAKNASSSEVKQ